MKGNIEAGWGRPSTTWVFGNKKHPDWFATQRACDLPGQLPASSHPHPPPPSATLKMFARREISFCKHKTRHGAMVWLKIGEIRSFFCGKCWKMNDGDEDVSVDSAAKHNKCLLSKQTVFNQTFRKSKPFIISKWIDLRWQNYATHPRLLPSSLLVVVENYIYLPSVNLCCT